MFNDPSSFTCTFFHRLKCLDRKDKEAEEEEGSAANVPALVAVDPEPEAAAVEPATEVGSVPQQQRKGLPFPIKGLQAVKALQQQNASRSARKRTASGGPTHSTSKRGAQMLELSRQKIQNNNNNSINGNEIPPGKKAKMSESLAETVLTELTTKSGITVNGLSSVSLLDCVVVTPESSPARKVNKLNMEGLIEMLMEFECSSICRSLGWRRRIRLVPAPVRVSSRNGEELDKASIQTRLAVRKRCRSKTRPSPRVQPSRVGSASRILRCRTVSRSHQLPRAEVPNDPGCHDHHPATDFGVHSLCLMPVIRHPVVMRMT